MRKAWPLLIFIPLLLWWYDFTRQTLIQTRPEIKTKTVKSKKIINSAPPLMSKQTKKNIHSSFESHYYLDILKDILHANPIDDTDVEDLEWKEASDVVLSWRSKVIEEFGEKTEWDYDIMSQAMKELYHPEVSPYFKYMYFYYDRIHNLQPSYHQTLTYLSRLAQDPMFAASELPPPTKKASHSNGMARDLMRNELLFSWHDMTKEDWPKLKQELLKNPGPSTSNIMEIISEYERLHYD
jgi:hypothetical protein